MAERHNKNVTHEKLTHEYKSTSPFDVELLTFNWVGIFITVLVLLAGAGINRLSTKSWEKWNVYIVIVTIIIGAVCLLGIKVAKQWERSVVLRLGKFHCLKGPGIFFVVPILESVVRTVDMRIRATDFSSESTLTKDTVPVNVDAICFWMVWDAKKAILEVESFYLAIVLSAQTALRDIIGTHQLSELLTNREKFGKKLQEVLDEKTNPWGITIQSVEIRDIILPKDLENAMSKEAQAERERHARIILSTAETEIAEKFAMAAKQYVSNPGAMHLRGMNMLFEGLKEKGSMIIVPSSALETMNLGAVGGMAALSQVKSEKDEREQMQSS